jgi:hypothetical protein
MNKNILIIIFGLVLHVHICMADTSIIDDVWRKLQNNDNEISSLNAEITLNQHVAPFLDDPSESDYEKAHKEFMLPVAGTKRLNTDSQKKISEQIKTKLLKGEDVASNFTIFINKDGIKYMPDTSTLENGASITSYLFKEKVQYKFSPSRRFLVVNSFDDSAIISNFSYITFPYTYLASYGRGITTFFKKNNLNKIIPDTDNIVMYAVKDNKEYKIKIRKSDYLITELVCKYKNNFNRLDNVKFDDYKSIERKLIPYKITVTVSNNSGKTKFTNQFSLKNVNFDKNIALVPIDFPLIQVKDERFKKALLYFAKGKMPSEEKILELATYSSEKLTEYNLTVQRVSK